MGKKSFPSALVQKREPTGWFLKNSLVLVLFVTVLEDGPSGFLSHYFTLNGFP